MNVPSPQVINGRYLVGGPLGAGGQGAAWAVRDLHQGEEVALKFIAREFGPWQEAQILTALRDRHILPVRNADYAAGVKFVVTELARHGTIQDRIEQSGGCGIDPEQAVRWARQACEGLIRTHSVRLLHNDIKPANIFLDDVGEALLGDFGLAMLMDQQGTTPAAGTWETMAPEVAEKFTQANSRPASIASDIYSLGATLYWMLTGVPPYQRIQGRSAEQTAAEVANQTPLRLRDLAPHVSRSLDQRIRRAMEATAASRYSTASAFSAALGSLPTSKRKWVRTNECSGHWGCWRGSEDRHATILICAEPLNGAKFEVHAVKLPKRSQIKAVTKTVTIKQLPAAVRVAIKKCT